MSQTTEARMQPPGLLDAVCEQLLPLANGHRVSDVSVGLGYTGVQLDDGRCGLAYTFRQNTGAGCCVLSHAGTLSGRTAAELAAGARSPHLITATIGLATLNALAPPAGSAAGDVLDLLSVEPTDTVGMVGCFGPLIGPLKSRAKTLHVFDQREDLEPAVLPDNAAERILPQCQVVIVTATALLNRTLDALLDHCRSAREIAILGPSTPMVPSVFASRGVTILSGIEVVDSQHALRIISEGGGTRQLGNSIRKVNLRLEAEHLPAVAR